MIWWHWAGCEYHTCIFTPVRIKLLVLEHGPLTRYAKSRVAHAPGMPGAFSPPPTPRETANKQPRHASRHVRDACAVMHVGIATRRWREKRSRRMRNPQFYVSGKRPVDLDSVWLLVFWDRKAVEQNPRYQHRNYDCKRLIVPTDKPMVNVHPKHKGFWTFSEECSAVELLSGQTLNSIVQFFNLPLKFLGASRTLSLCIITP